MKITQTLFFILVSSWCSGQVLDVPTGKDRVVSEGTVSKNGYPSHAFMIYYNGDISNVINKLKKDLGKGEVIINNSTNREILFRKIVRPEWSENKINMTFASISNKEQHAITITCMDNKKNDYLKPGTESQKKIKAYVQEIIQD